MTKFETLLQQYVNKDYNELLVIAKSCLEALVPEYRKRFPTEESSNMAILWIIFAALGADSKLSVIEKRFVCDLLTVTPDVVSNCFKSYSSKMADITDSFADTSSDSVKSQIITLVLCVSACDEKIVREETEFIRKILY